MAFFLIQYRHGAEVIFYLRFRKSAGLVVSILGHIRLYHRHLQVPAGQQPQACRRTGGFTHFQLPTAVLGLQGGVILTKYLVHAAGAGHTQTDGFVAARSQQQHHHQCRRKRKGDSFFLLHRFPPLIWCPCQ